MKSSFNRLLQTNVFAFAFTGIINYYQGDINIDVDEITLVKQRQHLKIGKFSSSMADSSAYNPKKLPFYKKNLYFMRKTFFHCATMKQRNCILLKVQRIFTSVYFLKL